MSARGNSCVNGYTMQLELEQVFQNNWLTTTSLRIPKSSHRIPGLKELIKNSVFSCVRRRALGSSRKLGFARHLEVERFLNENTHTNINATYFGHQP
jgi:hypothetical protein